MNIEIEIAEWLDRTTTELTAGTNLFIGDFSEDINEGVCVTLNRHLQASGTFSRANIQILLFYFDYVDGRTLLQTITDIFDEYRGSLNGDWATASSIYADALGKDFKGRNVFSIEFEVVYKEA
jgi:hypothetical protein